MRIATHGLRRSGNHAIAVWLLFHLKGGIEYFNNYNPRHDRHTCETYWHRMGKMLALRNTGWSFLPDINHTLYACENSDEETMLALEDLELDHAIAIIRDPLNNLASLIAHNDNRNKNARLKHDLLIKYAKFAPTWKFLAKNEYNCIQIVYDHWFANANYRRLIEKQLGLGHNDSGLNFMHRTGSGSSFDHMEYQGKAQEMDVLNRWHQYKDHELMQKLFKDQELMDMRAKIFGPIPDLDSLIL